MAYINWDDKYSVGISKIDEQHKKWIQYLNDLHDAMKSGKSKDIMNGLLNEMIQYTKTHFSLEEDYLKRYNYPGYTAHIAEHKKFTDKVMEFKSGFNQTGGILSIEVMNFMRDWLIKHIMVIDKQYSPFLMNKGIK